MTYKLNSTSYDDDIIRMTLSHKIHVYKDQVYVDLENHQMCNYVVDGSIELLIINCSDVLQSVCRLFIPSGTARFQRHTVYSALHHYISLNKRISIYIPDGTLE